MAEINPNQQSSTSRFFLGTPARTEQISRYTPEIQQNLNQLLFGILSGNVQSPMEQQTLRQFKSDIIPSIMERFAGMGASSAQRAALENAGTNLAENLQGQRFNQLQSLLPLSAQETYHFPEERGAIQGLLGQIIPAAAHLGMAYLTGGATLPASLASLFSNFGQQSGQQQMPQKVSQELPMPEPEPQPKMLSPQETKWNNLIEQLIGSTNQSKSPTLPSNPLEFNPVAYQLGGAGTRAIRPGQQNMDWLTQLLRSQKASGIPQGYMPINLG